MSTVFCPFRTELVLDHSAYSYPSRLICVRGPFSLDESTSTYYGFVVKGKTDLEFNGVKQSLSQNMYFALPGGEARIHSQGDLVLIQRWGYRGLPTFGGPTEEDGRLAYIDNSRATILIPPARLGDPVLNLLVFPKNVVQSPHLHPTSRLGVVISGSGVCVSDEKTELTAGMVFALEPFKVHSFNSGPDGLTVVAFHPDSDTGPTDERHPMKSRTYLV